MSPFNGPAFLTSEARVLFFLRFYMRISGLNRRLPTDVRAEDGRI